MADIGFSVRGGFQRSCRASIVQSKAVVALPKKTPFRQRIPALARLPWSIFELLTDPFSKRFK